MRIVTRLLLASALLLTVSRAAPARDPSLEALRAAIDRARDESSLQALPDPAWTQYFYWGQTNQDELVWLSGAVQKALLDCTGPFHVARPRDLPRDSPGVRRLLLVQAKTKLGGKNADEARRILRDLLDRTSPDTSPELAEALFLLALLERRALVERHPAAPATAMSDRMTGFFRQAEPFAVTSSEVELADTPEQAQEQKWKRTLQAFRAYANDRPEWAPALALECARALDMSRTDPKDPNRFVTSVDAADVVRTTMSLLPRAGVLDRLWFGPWGALYLGLFSSHLQEFARATEFYDQGIGLVETIVQAHASISDPRVPTEADLEVLRHPESLVAGDSAAVLAITSRNLLLRRTCLMEAQECFGDLKPGERGWQRLEGQAIAANGLPTAVGYEPIYDEFSADSLGAGGQWDEPSRGAGGRAAPVLTTWVTPARRTYVWKLLDGRVIRREYEQFAQGVSAGWRPTPDRGASAESTLANQRYDVQRAADQTIAAVDLPVPPSVAQTTRQVRAVSLRRSGADVNSFVIGLATSSAERAWFDGNTAEFSLLDANRYPVARSKGAALLGDHTKHRLPNGQDVYLVDLSTSGVAPGRYRWQLSLRDGGGIRQTYVPDEGEEVLIPDYAEKGLRLSDVRFQTSEVVPGAPAERAAGYVWSPFEDVFRRGNAGEGAAESAAATESTPAAASAPGAARPSASDPDARFNFMVEVYNLSASPDTPADYETHYAILPQPAFEEHVLARGAGSRPEAELSLDSLAAYAVAQDLTGDRFCQTAEVGAFTIPSHAVPGEGDGSVVVQERHVDYGERHLAVTVDLRHIEIGPYMLVMEVRDLRNGRVAHQVVPFAILDRGTGFQTKD